ncbi:MAG TPA: class I SAM-dependent methyltransferase [Actinomycetota bacterium]
MNDPTSVAFDRAAEYYDQTRGFSPQTEAAMTELLRDEFGGHGRVLEVGVGTGQVALPLHAAGVPLIGIDLARPMMDRLKAKAGGHSPFPLVQGDATRMPFADDAFGGAYLRWVLHLIPAWETAVAEILRVLAPGGTTVVGLGSYGGPRSEIQERFTELAGISIAPAGLMWDGYDQLDAAMAALGATPRALPSLHDPERETLATFIDGIANNRYSWTWKLEDPGLLARVADDVRRWAEERYGPLDRLREGTYEVSWRAYDLPG